MRHLIGLLAGVFFFGMSCTSIKNDTTMIRYTDQNNNQYTITKSLFEYVPITKNNSSSGIYDGGAPATGTITLAQFRELNKAATAVVNKAPENAKREMLTSVLTIQTQGTTTTKIVRKSEERSHLETLLIALKKSFY